MKLNKKGEEDEGGIPWKLLAIITGIIIMIIGLVMIAKGGGSLSDLFGRLH